MTESYLHDAYSLSQSAGPFMATIPNPPAGWTSPCAYVSDTADTQDKRRRRENTGEFYSH
jgi:hypothetical protein